MADEVSEEVDSKGEVTMRSEKERLVILRKSKLEGEQ